MVRRHKFDEDLPPSTDIVARNQVHTKLLPNVLIHNSSVHKHVINCKLVRLGSGFIVLSVFI